MILTPPSILLLPQTTLTRILPVSTVFPFLTHIFPRFCGRLLLAHLKLFNPLHAWRRGSSEIDWDDSDNSTHMHNNNGPYGDIQDSNGNYFSFLDGDDVEDGRDEECPVPRKVPRRSVKAALNYRVSN
jgi:hypothetical protein